MLTGLGGSDTFEEGAGVGAVGVETVVLELGGWDTAGVTVGSESSISWKLW